MIQVVNDVWQPGNRPNRKGLYFVRRNCRRDAASPNRQRDISHKPQEVHIQCSRGPVLGIRPDQQKGLFHNVVSFIRSDDPSGQLSRRRAVGAKRVA